MLPYRHLAAGALPLLLISPPVLATAPVASTINGTYEGIYNSTYNQDVFRGIPYAQPPTGPLRFAIPHSLNTSWHHELPRNATVFSPACPGYDSNAPGTPASEGGIPVSEDCLTLNIVRPHRPSPPSTNSSCSRRRKAQEDEEKEAELLPVLLWIHGGAFRSGASSLASYDPSSLVALSVHRGQPVVAVSINYRLAGLGWLWSAELEAEGASNLGLRDQRMALRWVSENIAAFGGDPEKVTIQGESAGALSVGHHMVAYEGRDDGLFRAGIAQSGTPATYKYYESAAEWQPFFDAVAEDIGCGGNGSRRVAHGTTTTTTLDCMRGVPLQELSDALLVNAPNENPYTPSIDGDMITQSTTAAMKQGKFLAVPFICGTNSDEGTLFAAQGINTTEEFMASMSEIATGGPGITDDVAHTLASLYPDVLTLGSPATYTATREEMAERGLGRQWKRVSVYVGDTQLESSRRLTARAWAEKGEGELFSYHFDVVPGAGASYDYLGVAHAAEIPFTFYQVRQDDTFVGKPPAYAELAEMMAGMWISFAHDLTPNGRQSSLVGAQPAWPSYTLDQPLNFVFDTNTTGLGYTEVDDFRAQAMDFIIDNYETYWRR